MPVFHISILRIFHIDHSIPLEKTIYALPDRQGKKPSAVSRQLVNDTDYPGILSIVISNP